MVSDPFDEYDPATVVDRRYQPKVVALDVKHYAVSANDTGGTVAAFHISGVSPFFALHLRREPTLPHADSGARLATRQIPAGFASLSPALRHHSPAFPWREQGAAQSNTPNKN